MVSMPAELLAQLDRQAERLGQSRSGLLQRPVRQEVAHRDAARQAEVEGILALAAPQGGRSVARLRAERARR